MSTVRIALISLLVFVVAAILLVGGVLYGQSTRQSDDEVAALVSQRVGAEARRGDRARHEALAEQEAALDRKHRKAIKRLNHKHLVSLKKQKDSAYQAGQSVGYSSGYDSGNSEGFEQGHENGLVEGSDSLTCSDDPDVSWLPYCDYDY